MTSERVDAEGMAHVAAAAAKYMQRAERSVQDVLSMRSAEDLAKWQRWAGLGPGSLRCALAMQCTASQADRQQTLPRTPPSASHALPPDARSMRLV